MSMTAKEYLDMIAKDLGDMFPGADVRSDENGSGAVLSARYTLPYGAETDVFVTLTPADNGMLAAQVIADLSGALPEKLTDDTYKKISDINNVFACGAIITGTDEDRRYCLYNSGFYIDTGLDLRDITVILGRGITDAELEFCSDEVRGLLDAGQAAQD